jgi:hypothetical protein
MKKPLSLRLKGLTVYYAKKPAVIKANPQFRRESGLTEGSIRLRSYSFRGFWEPSGLQEPGHR